MVRFAGSKNVKEQEVKEEETKDDPGSTGFRPGGFVWDPNDTPPNVFFPKWGAALLGSIPIESLFGSIGNEKTFRDLNNESLRVQGERIDDNIYEAINESTNRDPNIIIVSTNDLRRWIEHSKYQFTQLFEGDKKAFQQFKDGKVIWKWNGIRIIGSPDVLDGIILIF